MLQAAESNTWAFLAWRRARRLREPWSFIVLTEAHFCTPPPAAPASEVIAITAAG
jgi:hypothetical protein